MNLFGYESEDEIRKEICQILVPLKTRGMHEDSIYRGLRVAPFIQAKKECVNHPAEKGYNLLISELRRMQMWKVILKYINDGFTTSEISKSLKLPYSTVYYYRRKFLQRKKPKGDLPGKWSLGENKELIYIKEPYSEKKTRLNLKKTALNAAEEKRRMKAEKRLLINN